VTAKHTACQCLADLLRAGARSLVPVIRFQFAGYFKEILKLPASPISGKCLLHGASNVAKAIAEHRKKEKLNIFGCSRYATSTYATGKGCSKEISLAPFPQWLEYDRLAKEGLLTRRDTAESKEVLAARLSLCHEKLHAAYRKLQDFKKNSGNFAIPVGNLSARCFEYDNAMKDAEHFLLSQLNAAPLPDVHAHFYPFAHMRYI